MRTGTLPCGNDTLTLMNENQVTSTLTVVTGASKGLGASLVREFARHGKVIAAARHFADGVALPNVEQVKADLTRPEGLEAVRNRMAGRPVDILVNNAGTLGPRVDIEHYPEEDWDAVLQINLTAVFRLTKILIPLMRRPGGCILNVSSGAGRRAAPRWGAYAVSKFGIDGFSLLLAEELTSNGIRVHSINPGAMRTTMRAAAYPEEDPANVAHPDTVAPFFATVAAADADTYPVLLDAPR
jgi:NAD(P)-dependent dehydrogenase (short-subunit alcohol dehydrogenase family)